MLTDANKSNTRIVRLEPHIVRSPQLPHKRPPPRLTYSPRHISRYLVINTARATHPHHDPKPIPQRHRMKIDKCCQHHELIMIPSWPQTTRAWWACVSHGVLYIWCWMYVSYAAYVISGPMLINIRGSSYNVQLFWAKNELFTKAKNVNTIQSTTAQMLF